MTGREDTAERSRLREEERDTAARKYNPEKQLGWRRTGANTDAGLLSCTVLSSFWTKVQKLFACFHRPRRIVYPTAPDTILRCFRTFNTASLASMSIWWPSLVPFSTRTYTKKCNYMKREATRMAKSKWKESARLLSVMLCALNPPGTSPSFSTESAPPLRGPSRSGAPTGWRPPPPSQTAPGGRDGAPSRLLARRALTRSRSLGTKRCQREIRA